MSHLPSHFISCLFLAYYDYSSSHSTNHLIDDHDEKKENDHDGKMVDGETDDQIENDYVRFEPTFTNHAQVRCDERDGRLGDGLLSFIYHLISSVSQLTISHLIISSHNLPSHHLPSVSSLICLIYHLIISPISSHLTTYHLRQLTISSHLIYHLISSQ